MFMFIFGSKYINNELREEEEAEPPEGTTQDLFTCGKCNNPLPSTKRFKNPKCDDLHPICKPCIKNHIQDSVEQGLAHVKCPGLNCDDTLDQGQCKFVVSRELFNQWCDEEVAYCPYRDRMRKSLVRQCGGELKELPCLLRFERLHCMECHVVWHVSNDCNEWRRRGGDLAGILIRSVLIGARGGWTRCPNCGGRKLHAECTKISLIRCTLPSLCLDCGRQACECRIWTPEKIVILAKFFLLLFGVLGAGYLFIRAYMYGARHILHI